MMRINRIAGAVPTNIITGFLGVGKTSAILNLLKQKPDNERWAILVNEFGEVGIDGSLMQGLYAEEKGVYIKEVPGGCMCCSANLPMQIALNQLLAKANPHRLIIEPTGLGHPKEVVEILTAPHYRDVISLQKILTLVDARKIRDKRYTQHATFNQQIEIADHVIANKRALYSAADASLLNAYIKEQKGKPCDITFTDFGEIELATLEGVSQTVQSGENLAVTHHRVATLIEQDVLAVSLPDDGVLKAENQGEGYQSVGWRFDSRHIFSRHAFLKWAVSLENLRMKAVLITDKGVFGYNQEGEEISEIYIDDCVESRIEIIAPQVDASWEQQLWDCIRA